MIPRKILEQARLQMNDARCFGCNSSYNRSQHNKRAKRHTSKILRRILKIEMNDERLGKHKN